MATTPAISLPTLPSNYQDRRSFVEDFIINLIQGEYGDSYMIEKYFKTANKDLYQDCLNRIQQGVPFVGVRTRREDPEDYTADDKMDRLTPAIEIILAVPVSLEKKIPNTDRYVYVMDVLIRELLRDNPLEGIKRNTKRHFFSLGNRDIFRDEDVDIILAEYNTNYTIIGY